MYGERKRAEVLPPNGALRRPVGASYVDMGSRIPTEDEGTGLTEFWVALYEQWRFLIVTTAVTAFVAYAISLPQPPVYRATTSLEVQDQNMSFLNMRDVDPNSRSYSGESKLQTEMEMLESRSLRDSVRKKLAEQFDPEAPVKELPRSAVLETVGLGWLVRTPTLGEALAMAEATLTVQNPRMTRVVRLSCDATDPEIAAAFVNELAATYREDTIQGRLESYQQVGDWLNQQLDGIQASLQQSEDRLLEYSKTAGLVFTGEADDKLQQLQDSLAKAETHLLEKESAFQVAASRPPASVPDIVQDSVVQTYRLKLLQMNDQLVEMRTALKPEHYKVQRLGKQIDELGKTLREEEQNVIARLRNDYETAENHRKKLAAAHAAQARLVADQSGSLIHYNMLKREVETMQELYQTMSQKVKEASIASALRASNIYVIDQAVPAEKPYKPAPLQNALIGGSLGLFCGVMVVLMRRVTDSKFRSPGEVGNVLQTSELGAIPSGGKILLRGLPALGVEARKQRRKHESESLRPSLTSSNGALNADILPARRALQVESFRSVVTSLLSADEKYKIIAVTSAESRAGKTSIVSNLGFTLAEIGERVLLIDADMRRPRLHQAFGVTNSWGLSDLAGRSQPIDDSLPLEAICKPTEIEGLYLMSSGPASTNIPRLLYSARVKELLARCKKEFDTVVIDTPPVLRVADGRVVAQHADGVILVLRAGQTTHEMAITAYNRLVEDSASVIGTILNDWKPASERHYGYRNKIYS